MAANTRPRGKACAVKRWKFIVENPSDDGVALDRVGAAFQDLGALLLAAEAKAAAARAHRAAGRDASANASQERAAALVAACQGARTPGLGPAMPVSVLTPRERAVLHLAGEGLTSAEIGARLAISGRTAETHRANLMRKLGLRGHIDLVRYTIARGIVPPDTPASPGAS